MVMIAIDAILKLSIERHCDEEFEMKFGKLTIFGAGALALCAFLNPLQAKADTASVDVLSTSLGSIDVLSNGSTYNALAIPLISMNAQVRVKLDAQKSGRVKSWKTWIKVKSENGPWVQFSNNYDSASYSMPRPKTVNTVAVINVPYGTLQPFGLAQCNAMSAKMRNVGMSNAQIFSKDRAIDFNVHAAISFDMSGVPGENIGEEVRESYKKLTVNCKAEPYKGPTRKPVAKPDGPSRNTTSIKDAYLIVDGVSLSNGTCKLNLFGKIVGKEENQQIKFRYKDKTGKQSDIKTVLSGKGFTHQFNLVGTGLKQGKIYIDVEGENFNSRQKSYSVNCTANAPGGFNTGPTGGGGGAGASAAGTETVPQQPSTAPIMPGTLKVIPRKALKKRMD